MEKQEIKSKWDDLARQIGAELTPEAEQRAETHAAASESVIPRESAPSPKTRASLPKKPAADWAGLAGDLGLPPIEEEPLPVEQPAVQKPRSDERQPPREVLPQRSQSREPQSREPQSREPQQRERGQRDQASRESREPRRGRGGRGRGGRRDEQRGGADSGRQRREQRSQDQRRDEQQEPRRTQAAERSDSQQHDRGRSDARRETREPRRETPKPRDFETPLLDDPTNELPAAAETPSASPERELPAKSPAVSLWHKIFGAPSEPVADVVETSQQDAAEDAETDDRYEGQDDFARGEIRSLSGDEVIASGFVEDGVEGSTATDEEREQADQRRGRSRRRRRGGRGRKSGGRPREERSSEPRVHEQGGNDQLAADFDDLTDDEGDLSGDGGLDASLSVNGDAEFDDSDPDHSPAHSRSLSAGQRAIPSWDDAIGFIVESNMQNRSQRPSRPRSDSRGGPPRGRSRGRRR